MQLRYAILLAFGLLGWFNRSDLRYIQGVKAELRESSDQIVGYKQNPPKHSTEEQDSLYITRAELDISIVESYLAQYQKHHTSRAMVEATLRQLERDIEDRPVMGDDRDKV